MTTEQTSSADVFGPEWKPDEAALDHNRVPPSFAYKARELLRQRALTPDHPRWRPTTKLGAYALLDRLRIPHARVHRIVHGIDDLTPQDLAEPVLIKPVHGTSSRGIMLLHPHGGIWVNRLNGEQLEFGQVVEKLRRAGLRRGFADLWMLEEPLSPHGTGTRPVPDDIKVYAFQGEIALVLQRRTWDGQRRFRWFDASWRPVETGKHIQQIDHTLAPPDERDEIIELARRISLTFPLPFCRADMYATDHGVRAGELNGWAGGYDQFDDGWDQLLGAMWEDAEVRVPKRWRHIPAGVPDGAYPVRIWRRRVRTR